MGAPKWAPRDAQTADVNFSFQSIHTAAKFRLKIDAFKLITTILVN